MFCSTFVEVGFWCFFYNYWMCSILFSKSFIYHVLLFCILFYSPKFNYMNKDLEIKFKTDLCTEFQRWTAWSILEIWYIDEDRTPQRYALKQKKVYLCQFFNKKRWVHTCSNTYLKQHSISFSWISRKTKWFFHVFEKWRGLAH